MMKPPAVLSGLTGAPAQVQPRLRRTTDAAHIMRSFSIISKTNLAPFHRAWVIGGTAPRQHTSC